MNIGNILKVADAIEQASVPGLGFNMGGFIINGADDKSGNSCGTSACVAGWAFAVDRHSKGVHFKAVDDTSAFDFATDYFSLPHDDAYALFFPTDWRDSEKSPSDAVRCLRILAITGKVDWEAAMKPADPAMPALPARKSADTLAVKLGVDVEGGQDMSDWRDSYDDWKLRSPDWDDDPCAHIRAEVDEEMRDLHEEIASLKALIKGLVDNDPSEDAADGITVLDVWRKDARAALGLPDPSAPVEEEIVF